MYGYEDIFLSAPDGKLILGTGLIKEYYVPLKELYLARDESLEYKIKSDFYFCQEHNKIHQDIYAPLNNKDGDNFAFLVFRSNPADFLFPLINWWPLPSNTAETLILRQEGNEVLFLNELRHKKNTALSLRIPLSKVDVPAVQAVKGLTGIFEGKDYRDIEVLSYILPVPNTSWYMIAKIDEKEILDATRSKAVYIIVLAFAFILLFTIAIAFLYSMRQRDFYRELFTKEKELRETHQESQITLYSIGDGVITTDKTGLVKQMNPVAEKLTGWTESESKGKPIDEIFKLKNGKTELEIDNPVKKVLDSGNVVEMSSHTLLVSKSGEELPIADSGAPIRDEQGLVTGVVLVFRDQIKERESKRSLVESENRFRTAFQYSGAGICLTDIEGKIKIANKSLCSLLGYTEKEMVHFNLNNLTIGKEKLILQSDLNKMIANEINKVEIEKGFVKKGGDHVWTKVHSALIRDAKNQPLHLINQIVDVTLMKEVLEQSQKQREELQSLSHHLQSIRENERMNIAREIHDDLGQMLSFIKLNLSMIEMKMRKENFEKQIAHINDIKELISHTDKTINRVRKLVKELRPEFLDSLGLIPALENHIDDFKKRTGIKAEFESNLEEEKFSKELENAIFRIVQESLTNVARHSQTEKVQLSLMKKNEQLVFSIQDFGVGFNYSPQKKYNSFGILGMKERVLSVEGDIKITSDVGEGTKIECSFPLNNHNN